MNNLDNSVNINKNIDNTDKIKDIILDILIGEIFSDSYFEKYYHYFLDSNLNFSIDKFEEKLSYIKKMVSEKIYLFDINDVLLEENIDMEIIKEKMMESMINDVLYIFGEKDNYDTYGLVAKYEISEEIEEIIENINKYIFSKKIELIHLSYELEMNDYTLHIKHIVLELVSF